MNTTSHSYTTYIFINDFNCIQNFKYYFIHPTKDKAECSIIFEIVVPLNRKKMIFCSFSLVPQH